MQQDFVPCRMPGQPTQPMWAISLICSFLTLTSVASSDAPPLPSDLSKDMPEYSLGNLAEEERSLDLYDDKRQQILKKVSSLVRIRSNLSIFYDTANTDELERLEKVFKSSYEACASLSESSTWKKACMAGLFGRNTLNTLLRYFSVEFRQNTKEILLQTAFFVGDIDSLKAIIELCGIPKENVLYMVSELDIVFSGSVDFFNALLEILPTLMDHSRDLIREACSLNRLGILLRILEVAKPFERDELGKILDSFLRLKMCDDGLARSGCFSEGEKLYYVLRVAAQQGHLPIIRFLWPAVKLLHDNIEDSVSVMTVYAADNNHRSVLEFLLLQSGTPYTNMAQESIQEAFEGAVSGGHIEIMKLLTGKTQDGTFVFPAIGLTMLKHQCLYHAIKTYKSWDGIEYLLRLKDEGDSRFANFELVNHGNTALWLACEEGNYKIVKFLLRRTDSGAFIFPLTNPAVSDNKPLVSACRSGNLQIVKKLLKRNMYGKYIYDGIDPSAQNYQSIVNACDGGHLDVLNIFLERKDGKYVLPGVENFNIGCALLAAINANQIKIVESLLERKDGKYVFPGMEDVNLLHALSEAFARRRIEVAKVILAMKDGKYVLPGMKGVDLTLILSNAIDLGRRDIVELLLTIKDGKYVVPAMENVNILRALWEALTKNRIELAKLFLKMEDGNYVLPRLNSIDFECALLTAIEWNRPSVVACLLSKTLDGSYLFRGIKVTKDMIGTEGQSPEMRKLLEMHLVAEQKGSPKIL